MEREEFLARFKAYLLKSKGDKFDDGSSIAEYADDVGPLYWDDTWSDHESPEECAEADIECWGD